MKARLASIAACACAAIFPAAAELIYEDASNNLVGAGTVVIGGPDNQVLAQTLTIENSGILAGVMLPAACLTSRLYVLLNEVTPEGLPGSNIATGTWVSAPLLKQGRFTLVTWPPLAVTRGARYALMLASFGSDCVIARSTAGANYGGGNAYFYAAPENRWIAFSEIGDPDDLPFRLIMVD
jgi:hypothetical protein